jgi:oligopeptide transport system substrate-binding protein
MDIVGAETAIKNKSTKDLGIYCKTKTQLSFKLKKPSAQFIFNLAQPSLSPKANKRQIEFNQGNVLFSGPYKIKQWEKGNSILIENNTYFPIKIKRPLVKFYFISNDNTALTFYTQEKLSLLRRLPTHLKPQYQSSKDFFKIPTLRFDYIGFGSKLQTEDMTSFRQALSHHLNYQELKQLFQSEGTPGCPALLPQFYNGDLCLKKNTLKHSLEPSIQKKSYKLAYSVLGGNDHKKAMEWLQQQWKTNLGLKITLMPIEKGQLHYTLKNLQPDIFRKGVALRAPSCLSALESFHSESPNNYINLKSKDFDSLLEKMDNPLLNDKQLKDLCTKSINFLLSKNKIIPLGYFSYFMLQDGKFKGWKINALNQLDLTHLQTCDKLFCKDY